VPLPAEPADSAEPAEIAEPAEPAEIAEVRVWSGSDIPQRDLGRTVVTIGVFDGFHRGHQVIVSEAVRLARARRLPCVAITFDPHPSAVLRTGTGVPMLASVGRRIELLGQAGVDAVWVLRFTTELSMLTPDRFVEEVLVARLHPAAVVVGENFRFGHRASGDVTALAELGAGHDFATVAVSLAGEPGEPVWSSTGVRRALQTGDVAAAAQILGRPHRVEGVVVHGDHRGRELGYPTANLSCDPGAALPGDGVYSGWLVRADGQRLPAAISVGANPTFDGTERRAEAYVLDRTDLDLYGERVGLDFAARLRPMLRFESVADLLAQMAADVVAARRQVG
jgi:riboflavin kinase/FMN adenylyltransferase